MSNHFLEIAGVIVVLIIMLLIWLIREHVQAKKTVQLLNEYINRNTQDIAGLIATAIASDERLTGYEALLNSIQIKLADFKQVEATAQPYHMVIQKAQEGASITEVMQNFGLSKEEATLLIRLHGHKTKED